MSAQLIVFSGWPGTGKTFLARPLAQADSMWEELVGMLLALVEFQLEPGLSVVIDSVFMGPDRDVARCLAEKYEAEYLPIYTYVSDAAAWKQRVNQRVLQAPPEDEVATWESIQVQQRIFGPGSLVRLYLWMESILSKRIGQKY